MGQQITAKRRPFAGARQGESVTVTDPWGLVTDATKTLHAVMGRYRRHRWAALGLDRSPTVVRESRMWHRVLWEGRTSGLSCAIRADWLGADSAPMISVDFYSGEGRARRLTVRVGLRGEGRLATLALRAPRALPLALRRRWLKGARRAAIQRPAGRAKLWWVDPAARGGTPEDVTLFVFLVYLWQADLLRLDPDKPADPVWRFFNQFVQGPRRKAPDDLWSALEQMRQRFTLPGHWRGARLYLGRVFRSLRRPERRPWQEVLTNDGEITKHEIGNPRRHRIKTAPAVGVPRRTYFRWRSEGLREEQIKERARQRFLRRHAMDQLRTQGRAPDAARKFIQRAQTRGESIDKIIKRALATAEDEE